MKQIFTRSLQHGGIDVALLFVRIAIAALMLTHGLPKLGMLFSSETVEFPGIFGMSATLSLGLAVFAEVICSLLVFVGLGTRFAAIPLIFTMGIAAFYIHGTDPFSTKEMAILYLIGFSFLFIAGAGKYSFDNIIARRLRPVHA